jgi:hypothetical protein
MEGGIQKVKRKHDVNEGASNEESPPTGRDVFRVLRAATLLKFFLEGQGFSPDIKPTK